MAWHKKITVQKGGKVIFKLLFNEQLRCFPSQFFNSNFITKLFQFSIGSKPTRGIMWKLLDWLIGSDVIKTEINIFFVICKTIGICQIHRFMFCLDQLRPFHNSNSKPNLNLYVCTPRGGGGKLGCFACLFVCLFVTVLTTPELIGPNFFVGPHMTLGEDECTELQKNFSKTFWFS